MKFLSIKITNLIALIIFGIGIWFLYPLYEENSRLLWGIFFLLWSNNIQMKGKV